MTSSDISPENAEVYALFDRCNQTELYQIARRNGFTVLPNLSRDALIRIIIGEEQPPEVWHSIDEWRRAIMRFVIDHRRVLETQLTCPAKSLEPDACFGCVDARVMHCVTTNNRSLIAIRKKNPT